MLCTAGCVLATMGCGERTKIKECSALVAVINGGVDEVQKSTTGESDGGAPVDELRQLAKQIDAIAANAASIALTLPELKQLAADYQAMAKEVAAASRALAEAVDNVDQEKADKAHERMNRAISREAPLVERINKFCRTP